MAMIFFVALQILFSSSIYLFDFVSTGIVVIHYGMSTVTHLICHTNSDGGCNSFSSQAHTHQTQLRILFACMLLVLVCAHLFNAIFFRIKYNSREAPLIFIYFLPLVHLQRLLNILWRSCSFKGVEDIVSQDMNSMFSFLGIALETGPMFALQVSALQLVGEVHGHVIEYHASTSLKLSLIASLISALYNGGMSIRFAAKNAVTIKSKAVVGLATGMSTMGFMLQTALMYASAGNTQKLLFPILLVITTMLTNTFLYCLLLKAMDMKLTKLQMSIRGLGLSYVTITLGPLYPLMSGTHMQKYLGTWRYRILVLSMSAFNFFPSCATLFILPNYVSGLPTEITLYPLASNYKAFATLTSVIYGASLIAYVLADWACGRVMLPNHVCQDAGFQKTQARAATFIVNIDQEDTELLHTTEDHATSLNKNQLVRTRSYPIERSFNVPEKCAAECLHMGRLHSWGPK